MNIKNLSDGKLKDLGVYPIDICRNLIVMFDDKREYIALKNQDDMIKLSINQAKELSYVLGDILKYTLHVI